VLSADEVTFPAPNISLDGTGDAGRVWKQHCMIGVGMEKRR
jgi:hypothetical protein